MLVYLHSILWFVRKRFFQFGEKGSNGRSQSGWQNTYIHSLNVTVTLCSRGRAAERHGSSKRKYCTYLAVPRSAYLRATLFDSVISFVYFHSQHFFPDLSLFPICSFVSVETNRSAVILLPVPTLFNQHRKGKIYLTSKIFR